MPKATKTLPAIIAATFLGEIFLKIIITKGIVAISKAKKVRRFLGSLNIKHPKT